MREPGKMASSARAFQNHPTGVFPAAPEQSEKLYDVGGAGSIGVGEYEHREALIARNFLRPVIVPPEEITQLGE